MASSSDNRLLAMDIGGGTQDILLWDPQETVENSVKLVLPSPTRIVARRIQTLTAAGKDIFLTGRLMGGGAVSQAVRQHLQQGLKVSAQAGPARTLHDNLERLRQWGIRIVEAQPPGTTPVVLGDVDVGALRRALAEFAVELPDHCAVAVQDHGFSPEASNRRHRFQHWENFLAQGGELRRLAYQPTTGRSHQDGGHTGGFAGGAADGYLRRRCLGSFVGYPGPEPAAGRSGGGQYRQ